MGMYASAELLWAVQIPQELDEETYEDVHAPILEKLHDCDISVDFDYTFGGGHDWGLDDAPCYLIIKKYASSYGEGGVPVPELSSDWNVDEVDPDIARKVMRFCEEHDIPYEPKFWLVESYG